MPPPRIPHVTVDDPGSSAGGLLAKSTEPHGGAAVSFDPGAAVLPPRRRPRHAPRVSGMRTCLTAAMLTTLVGLAGCGGSSAIELPPASSGNGGPPASIAWGSRLAALGWMAAPTPSSSWPRRRRPPNRR